MASCLPFLVPTIVPGAVAPLFCPGLLPRQVVQALKLGELAMAERAPMLLNCLTCYLCQESCP